MNLRKLAGLALLLGFLGGTMASAAELPYPTYTYSYEGEVRYSPAAYTPSRSVEFGQTEAGALKNPSDLVVDSQNRLYIADTENNRIVILDETMRPVTIIAELTTAEGEATLLSKPEGVCVAEDGALYIADTGNSRLVVLNADHTVRQIVTELVSPALPESFVFNPSAVAVDGAGRVYTVVKGNIMGVVALTSTGEFDCFMGAQRVVPDFVDLFWRLFMTQDQIDRLPSFVPTEFNNVVVDDEGFVFATTNSIEAWAQYSAAIGRVRTGDYAPVKKLNPSGNDVLRRNGFFPPAGDIKVEFNAAEDSGPSSIIDVAMGPNGVFTLLDSRRSRLFTYDADGNLLFAFGEKGFKLGCLEQAAAVVYRGDELITLDKKNGRLTVFQRTAYGDRVNNAISLYNDRQYGQSAAEWAALSEINNNLDLAYIGLGKSCYREGDYDLAMKYFESAHDRENYSKAFEGKRREMIAAYFLPILLGGLAAIALVVALLKLAGRRVRAVDAAPAKRRWFDQELYALRVLCHPFEGFGEIRRSDRVGVVAATVVLLLTIVTIILNRLGSGFLISGSQTASVSGLLTTAAAVLVPVVLFCAANWCLSSLMDGEGRFVDIYKVVCFSLTPILLLNIPMTIAGNLLAMEELAFYNLFSTIAWIWFVFLLFSGMTVVHNYSFTKNLVTLFLTLVGMVVIAFLFILFGNLVRQVVGFVYNLYMEISFRF